MPNEMPDEDYALAVCSSAAVNLPLAHLNVGDKQRRAMRLGRLMNLL
jgi:hypothetical protein